MQLIFLIVLAAFVVRYLDREFTETFGGSRKAIKKETKDI